MASVFDRVMLLEETSCILYQPDETSPVETHIVLSNYRSIGSRRTANDFHRGRFPPGTEVTSGQLIWHTELGWFVVEKRAEVDPMTLRPNWVEVQLLPLPYVVEVQRPKQTTQQMQDTTGVLDVWDVPTGQASDALGETTLESVAYNVRMGFSNDADPQHETVVGNLPFGSITAYCPLGSNVLRGDILAATDGYRNMRWYKVTDFPDQAAMGRWYMLQLILTKLTGPDWETVPAPSNKV